MYINGVQPAELLQGDIIKEYPFCYIPKLDDYLIVRAEQDLVKTYQFGSLESKYIAENNREEQVIVNSKIGNIMLLSQTCDLQRRPKIMAAPIFPVSHLKTILEEEGNTEQQINGKINSLKAVRADSQLKYYFYLPANGFMPESYVDFNLVFSIPRENIDISNRIQSLSDRGRHWLSYKVIEFFGRPVEIN